MNVLPISFKSGSQIVPGKGNSGYENPINRNSERNLAIWTSVGGSAIAGTVAAGIASCMMDTAKKGYFIPLLAGAVVTSLILALTLPSRLYNTKVGAFAREKEMDVFSRSVEAKSGILEGVNGQIKDENVPLAEKISSYAQVQMANNGTGLMIKNV